jgi:hypothetical protein
MRSPRPLLILFLLWHMAAVAAWSVPEVASDPVARFVRATVTPLVRPYILLTSQWQQWNLLAPDPPSTTFALLLIVTEGKSVRRIAFPPAELNRFTRWNERNVLGNILDDGQGNQPLLESYLRSLCGALWLKPAARLRLLVRSHATVLASEQAAGEVPVRVDMSNLVTCPSSPS